MSLSGGFYRIGAPQIKELPIVIPESIDIISEIENCVDKIQELNRADNLTQDDEETINGLRHFIDEQVFRLYGLTDSEIAYVRKEK